MSDAERLAEIENRYARHGGVTGQDTVWLLAAIRERDRRLLEAEKRVAELQSGKPQRLTQCWREG